MKIIFLQSRYERFRQCWVGNPAHHNIFLHKNLHEDQKNCFVMDGGDEKGDQVVGTKCMPYMHGL